MTRTKTKSRSSTTFWPSCPECEKRMTPICSNEFLCRIHKIRATWNKRREKWEFEKVKKLL